MVGRHLQDHRMIAMTFASRMKKRASDLTVTAYHETVAGKALRFSNLSGHSTLADKALIRLLPSQPPIWHSRNAAAKSGKSSFSANTTQTGQNSLWLIDIKAL